MCIACNMYCHHDIVNCLRFIETEPVLASKPFLPLSLAITYRHLSICQPQTPSETAKLHVMSKPSPIYCERNLIGCEKSACPGAKLTVVQIKCLRFQDTFSASQPVEEQSACWHHPQYLVFLQTCITLAFLTMCSILTWNKEHSLTDSLHQTTDASAVSLVKLAEWCRHHIAGLKLRHVFCYCISGPDKLTCSFRFGLHAHTNLYQCKHMP